MQAKLKSFLWSEQTFLAGLLCLVGIFSYQLGQSSVEVTNDTEANQQNQAGIIFSNAPKPTIPTDVVPVVASSGGTKYHKLDCPGADSIKEDNKIYFNSLQEAKAAGYTAASNCKF